MRTFMLVSSILALLLTAGCSDNSTNSGWDPTGDTGTSEIVQLDYGDEASVDDGRLKIAFDGLIWDERCAANAFCNWEGFAEIQLRLIGPEGDTVRTGLGMLESYPLSEIGSIDTFGYRIVLTELMPYPGVDPFGAFAVDTSSRFKSATIEVQKEYVSVLDPVIITDIDPKALLVHSYDIDSVVLDGNVLKMRARYGGGCRRHYFQVFMSPAIFMESEPVQARLYLRHFGIRDPCEAYWATWVEVDLTPVADLYRRTYGQDGQVTLNIEACHHTVENRPECPARQVTFTTSQAPGEFGFW